jgi:hypothetical protein
MNYLIVYTFGCTVAAVCSLSTASVDHAAYVVYTHRNESGSDSFFLSCGGGLFICVLIFE